MSVVAERWKIEAVLSLARSVPFDSFQIPGSGDRTSKTYAFMTRIGYVASDVKRVVERLGYIDYSRGPMRDDKGRPHDLWVFGTYVQRFQTYIKLTVFVRDGKALCVCVSFHEAERPMIFPYRGGLG